MNRYAVVFEESAQADVRTSYDWGCRVWGKKEARRWVRELRSAVTKQLSVIPKGFPLAPENDEFPEEIRQMIVGRYRVLFTIKKGKVHVLRFQALTMPASRRWAGPANWVKDQGISVLTANDSPSATAI